MDYETTAEQIGGFSTRSKLVLLCNSHMPVTLFICYICYARNLDSLDFTAAKFGMLFDFPLLFSFAGDSFLRPT